MVELLLELLRPELLYVLLLLREGWLLTLPVLRVVEPDERCAVDAVLRCAVCVDELRCAVAVVPRCAVCCVVVERCAVVPAERCVVVAVERCAAVVRLPKVRLSTVPRCVVAA